MLCASFIFAMYLCAQETPVVLDHIVALVNDEPILESDVQQELHMATFVPGLSNAHEASGENARTNAIARLIDRALISAQEQWQTPTAVTDAELSADITELQRRIPDCAQNKCATPEGWAAVLKSHGFTPSGFSERWRTRMTMLRFIEQRFRVGIRIRPEEIDNYYRTVLTPQYVAVHATPPPLSSVSNRIEQLLLEQHISSLLEDWLKQLRTEGNVRILAPGEDLP